MASGYAVKPHSGITNGYTLRDRLRGVSITAVQRAEYDGWDVVFVDVDKVSLFGDDHHSTCYFDERVPVIARLNYVPYIQALDGYLVSQKKNAETQKHIACVEQQIDQLEQRRQTLIKKLA